MSDIFDALKAHFPVDSIHWRAQTVTENGKALALAYLNARDVMDRLDAVVGPGNWQDYYDETPSGRVICKLTLIIDGQPVTKSDGAGATGMEGEKGGISDAFKRAAVKWGIGRYLYALGNVWADCEVTKRGDKFYFRKWKTSAKTDFHRALTALNDNGNGSPNRHANVKLEGKYTSISALEKAIKSFASDMGQCVTWEDWVGLQNDKKYAGLLEQAKRDHPDWWNGWEGAPDGFVPLSQKIENLEMTLANTKAEMARA